MQEQVQGHDVVQEEAITAHSNSSQLVFSADELQEQCNPNPQLSYKVQARDVAVKLGWPEQRPKGQQLWGSKQKPTTSRWTAFENKVSE